MDPSHNVREGHTAPFDVLTFWHEEQFFSTGQWQWRMQGRGPGSPDSPLFLDQTEVRRAEKIIFWDLPASIPGCGWLPPPLLSEGLYLPLSRLIEFQFEVMVTGSPLLSSRRFFQPFTPFIAHSLFRSSRTDRICQEERPS